MTIRIGTRGSKLARWQAEWVAAELAKHGNETEIVYLKTLGDVKSGPIGSVGSEGVFTREIQRALLEDKVDLAVHSLKDLPTDNVDGLSLAAIPQREQCGDALIANEFQTVDDLPQGAILGTGSARRKAQLLAFRPDLQVQDLRGNVDTRLQKLRDGEFHAIVLAEAGLRRLGLDSNITQVIPKSVMLPAVGQGALGLETRDDDASTRNSLGCLHHEETYHAVLAERSLLRSLRGGCLAPVGAWARVENQELRIDAIVLNASGTEYVSASATTGLRDSLELGERVAHELVAKGADRLLDSARQ